MPSGVYPRTKKHCKINSEGHKRYWDTHIMDMDTRRKISFSLLKYNKKKLEVD